MSAATVAVDLRAPGARLRSTPVVALARVEAVRIVRHPAFLLGAVAAAVFVWRALRLDVSGSWAGEDYFLAFIGWFPLWLGTLVAAALTAGRGRFLNDPDLFSATPAPPGVRVLGTALAVAAPVVVTSIAVTAVAAAVASRGGFHHAELRYSERVLPPPVEWLQLPLLVLLAGVVGHRHRPAPQGAAGCPAGGELDDVHGLHRHLGVRARPDPLHAPLHVRRPEHRLPLDYRVADWSPGDAPLRFPDEYERHFREIRFDTAAMSWHLVYLVGLILTVLWVALRLAGDGRRFRWLLAGLPLVVIAVVAQIIAVGPTP